MRHAGKDWCWWWTDEEARRTVGCTICADTTVDVYLGFHCLTLGSPVYQKGMCRIQNDRCAGVFLPGAKLVCPSALLYIPGWRFCQNYEFAVKFHSLSFARGLRLCSTRVQLLIETSMSLTHFHQISFVWSWSCSKCTLAGHLTELKLINAFIYVD